MYWSWLNLLGLYNFYLHCSLDWNFVTVDFMWILVSRRGNIVSVLYQFQLQQNFDEKVQWQHHILLQMELQWIWHFMTGFVDLIFHRMINSNWNRCYTCTCRSDSCAVWHGVYEFPYLVLYDWLYSLLYNNKNGIYDGTNFLFCSYCLHKTMSVHLVEDFHVGQKRKLPKQGASQAVFNSIQ